MSASNSDITLLELEEEGDKVTYRLFFNILSFLRMIFSFLVYLLLLVFRLRSHYRSYVVENKIPLIAKGVVFTRSKRTNQWICLKVWRRSRRARDTIREQKEHMKDLLDGLAFNQKFAPGVFLGVAPVKGGRKEAEKIWNSRLIKDSETIQRGWLIRDPYQRYKDGRLDMNLIYVLVMRKLKEEWRLDRQLKSTGVGTQTGIEFLAKEVAKMHRQLEESPKQYGDVQNIEAKLARNKDFFEQALRQLAYRHIDHIDVEKYREVSKILQNAFRSCTELFVDRYKNNCIKRCHGDLKTTNLWVRPACFDLISMKKYPRQLLAIDCIDFRPEYCHIDTLSDIAMLAMDMEMHDEGLKSQSSNELSKHFLDCYLREMQEPSEIALPILAYYITEKAMVCANVSILLDNKPKLGKKYLDLALEYAQRLKKHLENATPSIADTLNAGEPQTARS